MSLTPPDSEAKMAPALPTDSGNETVGRRLRRLRTERGFSQRELSGPGVSYAYISRIEAGARRPSVKAPTVACSQTSDLAGLPRDRLGPERGRFPRAAPHRGGASGPTGARLGDRSGFAGGSARRGDCCGDKEAAVRARLALGLSAARKGKDHEAIGYLETAFEAERPLAKDRPDIYATLGRSLRERGRSRARGRVV